MSHPRISSDSCNMGAVCQEVTGWWVDVGACFMMACQARQIDMATDVVISTDHVVIRVKTYKNLRPLR